MGTLGNAGTAAGGPKIHDNFMRSRAGLFSPAAGSQEMVFGAYIFWVEILNFGTKVSDEKPSTLNRQGGGS